VICFHFVFDFKKFLESVEEFNIEKEYRSKSEFDEVLDNDKLDNYLINKKIMNN
jgi:hypothetical protein